MIVYELRCTAGHGFEAWFRNRKCSDQQHAAHQISCPICGIEEVSKAPMALAHRPPVPGVARAGAGTERPAGRKRPGSNT